MSPKQLHSVGWVVYYLEQDGQPRFLIIKRHARSKKIERVAPKGKVEAEETPEQTCLREIKEETWLNPNHLTIKDRLGELQIKNINFGQWFHEKEVTYYLVHHIGKPEDVDIQPVEWFVWVYKRATIQEITSLILYPSMREIFRKGHYLITQQA
jgi:8-oxo-dGTP pyrophosphatase MutT (NUDIX family)